MNSRTVTAIAIAAVIVIGAIWAVSRQAPAPAPTPDAAAPAAGTAAEATPATGASGATGNAPAAPPGDGCSQYTWDGVNWICTSGSSGN